MVSGSRRLQATVTQQLNLIIKARGIIKESLDLATSDPRTRSKFDKYITLKERHTFFKDYVKAAIPIFALPLSIPVCRDPKDDKYLALALAAKAKVIVTGDLDLLVLHPFQGIPILKSSDFLEFAL